MGSEGKIQSGDGGEAKKKRFVWTVEKHGKFVEAVNLIGLDKATPKKIMLAMKMPNELLLTRNVVSSHWQKYRSKLLKEEEEHRRILVQQTPDNGILKHAETAQRRRQHAGLGSSTLQVSVANSVDPQQLLPSSHHIMNNGSTNFFGNHAVAAARSSSSVAGSCLQAADGCSEFGYGVITSTTVESDPLEFTVLELIDNIDN